MTAKEKAIKEAYGEHWDRVKNYVDKNGWCRWFDFLEGIVYAHPNSEGSRFRPKSLSDIENNNDWIRIESESDLPKENIDTWFVYSEKMFKGAFSSTQKQFYCDGHFLINGVTHYKQIEKPKPPIY